METKMEGSEAMKAYTYIEKGRFEFPLSRIAEAYSLLRDPYPAIREQGSVPVQ